MLLIGEGILLCGAGRGPISDVAVVSVPGAVPWVNRDGEQQVVVHLARYELPEHRASTWKQIPMLPCGRTYPGGVSCPGLALLAAALLAGGR